MHHTLKFFTFNAYRLCESEHALHTCADVLPDANLGRCLPLCRGFESVDRVGSRERVRRRWLRLADDDSVPVVWVVVVAVHRVLRLVWRGLRGRHMLVRSAKEGR